MVGSASREAPGLREARRDRLAGHIHEQGAIDVAGPVRDQITTVMEGDERAFRRRKEKYGF